MGSFMSQRERERESKRERKSKREKGKGKQRERTKVLAIIFLNSQGWSEKSANYTAQYMKEQYSM